jgi:hypothetical protein
VERESCVGGWDWGGGGWGWGGVQQGKVVLAGWQARLGAATAAAAAALLRPLKVPYHQPAPPHHCIQRQLSEPKLLAEAFHGGDDLQASGRETGQAGWPRGGRHGVESSNGWRAGGG